MAKWDEYTDINNCYSFAFDNLNKNPNITPEPGYLSNNTPLNHYTCNDLVNMIKQDYPDIRFDDKCKHPVYLVIDPEHNDYHFYVKNHIWQNKHGYQKVTNLDAVGDPITNPELANKNYGNYQYTQECGYICK
jgi:hypothetical protein